MVFHGEEVDQDFCNCRTSSASGVCDSSRKAGWSRDAAKVQCYSHPALPSPLADTPIPAERDSLDDFFTLDAPNLYNTEAHRRIATSNKCLTSSNKKLLGAPGLLLGARTLRTGLLALPLVRVQLFGCA